jgi:hypothetical protein
MNIVLTGHTNGIGLAFYNELVLRGHDVVGYSISNNFDISKSSVKDEIISQLNNSDVFINNVYSPGDQYDLLDRAINLWKGKQKLIVNLGSKSIYADFIPDPMKEYVADKQKQNLLIEQRKLKANPHILNLILGLVDTSMSRALDAKKLDPADVAKLVVDIIELKDKIYIQNLTMDVPFQDWDDIKHKSI